MSWRDSRKITIGILVVITVLLIAWDIVVAANARSGDTISEVTLGFAMRHPVLPFAIGVICGHLFWPQRLTRK